MAPCVAGQLKLKVSATGDVTACELLPIPLGNIREDSLESIWRCEATKQFSNWVIAESCANGNDPRTRRCPGLALLGGEEVEEQSDGGATLPVVHRVV